MIDRKHLAVLVAAGFACWLVAGCGGPSSGSGAAAGVGASPSSATSKHQSDAARVENMIADCMKQQGFSYIPHPLTVTDPNAGNLAVRDPALVSYADLKTYRTKYGFGVFSALVYPNDPSVATRQAPDPSANPNNAIRAGLDPAQRQAYDTAMNGVVTGKDSFGKQVLSGGCAEKAAKAVYGDGPTQAPTAAAAGQQAVQDFQTNPQLLQLSQSYASCLRQHGYPVSSTQPGQIEQALRETELAARAKAGSTIDAATAQADLTTEIKMSLDDLECGKAYEAAAKPFVQKMQATAAG